MKYKIEKRDEHKSSLLVDKKNIDKSWENELSQWIIEEFYSLYQAS